MDNQLVSEASRNQSISEASRNQLNKEINDILNKNKVEDLKKFLGKRSCLNKCNSVMMYLFYIVQSLGILATSISATVNDPILLWAGIALNMCASIIQVYEKINNDQMKKILIDIQAIKNGTYIDESPLIDIEVGTQNRLSKQVEQQSQEAIRQNQSSQKQSSQKQLSFPDIYNIEEKNYINESSNNPDSRINEKTI